MTSPVIILVRPQLNENIGMCARAMLNCGVTQLRLVSPKQEWPGERAVSASSGALDTVKVELFNSVENAVADLEYVVATTARSRDMNKPVMEVNAATAKLREHSKYGIMFGPERTGLENDDLILADALLNIPLNPKFSSLNLAQAVLLVCFSWLNADNQYSVSEPTGDTTPAKKEAVDTLLKHLESDLDNSGFFKNPEQKPTTWRNIQSFFVRANPSTQEVSTLHGILSALSGKKNWK